MPAPGPWALGGDTYEVEFVEASGRTQALVTVAGTKVRTLRDKDLTTRRSLAELTPNPSFNRTRLTRTLGPMPAEIATAIIAASGAILLAGASYWFTKKRERDAELRKEKLEHYKEFAASLSGVISGEFTAEGQRAFSRGAISSTLLRPRPCFVPFRNSRRRLSSATPRIARNGTTSLCLSCSTSFAKTWAYLQRTTGPRFTYNYGRRVQHPMGPNYSFKRTAATGCGTITPRSAAAA